MQKHLSVKNQSVESSGITKDFREAICEYIWNGFEAGATKVEVTYTLNSLDGIDTITIIDNGKGIEFESLEDTFGAFLASQKNSLSVSVKSKDNKGKGRFSFNCFAANAEWITTYKKDNTFFWKGQEKTDRKLRAIKEIEIQIELGLTSQAQNGCV